MLYLLNYPSKQQIHGFDRSSDVILSHAGTPSSQVPPQNEGMKRLSNVLNKLKNFPPFSSQ